MSLGRTPLTIITLCSDTPRDLAVTPDDSMAYAATFHSGNRTTALHQLLLPDGDKAAGGSPGPTTNCEGMPAPEVGIIRKFNGTLWGDELNRVWDSSVRLSFVPNMQTFPLLAAGPMTVSARVRWLWCAQRRFADPGHDWSVSLAKQWP